MEYLKKLRKAHGLTMVNMSKIMGISSSLYFKVESGERSPSVKFLKKLKAAFPKVNMNIFFES